MKSSHHQRRRAKRRPRSRALVRRIGTRDHSPARHGRVHVIVHDDQPHAVRKCASSAAESAQQVLWMFHASPRHVAGKEMPSFGFVFHYQRGLSLDGRVAHRAHFEVHRAHHVLMMHMRAFVVAAAVCVRACRLHAASQRRPRASFSLVQTNFKF